MSFWSDDFEVDVPEFRLPPSTSDSTLFKMMPRHEWEAIEAAAEAADQGAHRRAEACRSKAGYHGLGGEPVPNDYWPHDYNPED